jgi:hypothetical protein
MRNRVIVFVFLLVLIALNGVALCAASYISIMERGSKVISMSFHCS